MTTKYYDSGKTSHVRKGTLKFAISNACTATHGIAKDGVENPESEVILVDRVVIDIKTAAEAACFFTVAIGDNATDNVMTSVQLLSVNALNIGVVQGIEAGVNSNCKVAAKGAVSNAFIMAGVNVNANADSLVADVYVDYIIP